MLRRREKTSADNLQGKQPTSTSRWDFQPPDWETRTVCLKQPSLWCFVRVPGHQQGVGHGGGGEGEGPPRRMKAAHTWPSSAGRADSRGGYSPSSRLPVAPAQATKHFKS